MATSSSKTPTDGEQEEDTPFETSQSPWTRWFLLALFSVLSWERQRQKRLTAIPRVFYQRTTVNDTLCSLMSGVLLRSIRPSLIIGTHSIMNSFVGYARPGPVNKNRFREIVRMASDGGQIGVDWEIPSAADTSTNQQHGLTKQDVLKGKIRIPTVLILTGSSNDSEYGYIRSFMRSCTAHGWVAACINYRGSANVPFSTPRSSTVAYTNDLRHMVYAISSRLKGETPLFLVGYSKGANLVVKYLGEEGFAGTLPQCVRGGVSVSNPIHLVHHAFKWPWNKLIHIGAKLDMRRHKRSLYPILSHHTKKAFDKSFESPNLFHMVDAYREFFIRNDEVFPFAPKYGYASVREFDEDASCCNYVSHVSVPLLIISAADDDLVHAKTVESLSRFLQNPNVVVVQTKSGGHIGWHIAPWQSPFGSYNFPSEEYRSWIDIAAPKFIESVLNFRDSAENNSNKATKNSFQLMSRL